MVEASGYGVIYDGTLSVKTIHDTELGAIVNFLGVYTRERVNNSWSDKDIHKVWNHYELVARVIPVTITYNR